MTNIALLVLALTVAGEPAAQPASAAAAPARAAPAADAAAAAPPALAKPPESDIEVLAEVVDLQAAAAEDPKAAWYGPGYPVPVRILALPTARTHRAGGWEIVIDHRSVGAIYDSSRDHPWRDTWNSFAGLDSSVRAGLGFRYGVLDNLDVGLYRAGTPGTDTYQLDARFQAMRQADLAVDLGVLAGVTWFSQPNTEDAARVFGQLLVSRLFANRVLLAAGVFYHPSSTNDTKYNQDQPRSLAAGGGVEVRVAAPLALDAEMVACMAGYCSKNPTFSAGVKLLTARHTFAVVCGNTTYLTADGYIANTDRPWSKLTLGFHITRSH
jgi:hypothetical protein